MSDEIRKIKECIEGLIIHPPFRHMIHDEIEEYIVNVLTDALDAIQKSYDLGKAEAVPEGHVVAPIKIDDEGINLIHRIMTNGWFVEEDDIQRLYEAMITAAQKAGG